tara:strand:+ start:166 stop:417 length:252 start_codon:yes stop_codon:yes gene_type:complete
LQEENPNKQIHRKNVRTIEVLDGQSLNSFKLVRYIWNVRMAERTGFEPVEERLAPHRFSKPAHSTTLPSLLEELIYNHSLLEW